MISRRQLVILLLFFAALTLGIILHERQPWPEPGRAEAPSFDVERVVALTWTDHGREQKITKDTPPWKIARRDLTELAHVALEKTAVPSRPDVTLEVEFATGESWTANYYNGVFAWATGPRAGEGFQANEDLWSMFQEGEFAFRDHRWMWCTTRPLRFEFESNGRNYALKESHRGWQAERDGQPAQVDTPKVDAWIARTCEFKIDRFRDLKVYPLGLNAGDVTFVAHFPDGGRWELREKNGVWSIGAQPFAFRSGGWNIAIKELGELIF